MSNAQIDPEVNEFLGGSGGPPAVKFPTPGTTVKGTVLRAEVRQARDLDNNPKFWPDGNKVKQLVVWLQTDMRDPERQDDDGIRRLFAGGTLKAESKSLRSAIIEALQKANAKLEPGGTLAVRYIGEGPRNPARPMLNPPKQYVAQYEAPKAGALSVGDLINDTHAMEEEEPF